MFKFLKNLIPVSRKRYDRDQEGLLTDIKKIETKNANQLRKLKEQERKIEKMNTLESKNKTLSLTNEYLQGFLDKEQKKNENMLKTLIEYVKEKDEKQIKAVG